MANIAIPKVREIYRRFKLILLLLLDWDSSPPLSVKLPVERFDPSDSFGVIPFTEISLSRCEVSMSQNELADDFYRGARPGGIGCCMASEIVRP